jgi:hypothetical protein
MVNKFYSDGLQAGRLGFHSQQGTDLFLLHNVLSGSGAHPTSYRMDTRDLVPMSRMLELYLHSAIHIHGIVLNYLSTGITLPLPFNALLHLCLGNSND